MIHWIVYIIMKLEKSLFQINKIIQKKESEKLIANKCLLIIVGINEQFNVNLYEILNFF